MFFTQEDYNKIYEYIRRRGIKDTEFGVSSPLDGTELISLVQKGNNVKTTLSNFLASFRTSNFINVTEIGSNPSGKYTLEEAIREIKKPARVGGCLITFIDKETNDWKVYQFLGKDKDDWYDLEYWRDILGITEKKFKGAFISEEALYNTVKAPEVGDYAFVGTSIGESVVYVCKTRFVWSSTTEKATEYLTVLIQGTVTVGPNGNWFNNGEDTGIPAKGEKGDKPYFRFNATTGNVEYSFNQTDWEVLVNKEEITGAAATVTVGKVTTLDENSNAQVTNSGTTNAVVLNFKIPKGKTGDGLVIKGTYDTEEILKEKVTSPKIGDNYAVGTAAPYHLWCYTNVYNSETESTTAQWKDLGELTKDTTIITQSLGDKEDIVPSQALLNKQVKNIGLDEYEEFSEAKTYNIGDTVKYNGLLYTFTTAHVAGPWDESHVESASLKKEVEDRFSGFRFPIYAVENVIGGTPLSEDEEGKSGLYLFGASLNDTPYTGTYHSYRITINDETHKNKVHSVCFKPVSADYNYRTFAIYNSNGTILTEQSFKSLDEWLLVRLRHGQTILVTSSCPPLLDCSYMSCQEYNRTKLLKYYPAVRYNSLELLESEDNTVNLTDDEYKFNVTWAQKIVKPSYSYLCAGAFHFNKNNQYVVNIKNNSLNNLSLGLALSSKKDWSGSSVKIFTGITINSEEFVTYTFDYNVFENSSDFSEFQDVYLLVIFKGYGKVDIFNTDGNFDIQIFNSEITPSSKYSKTSNTSELSTVSENAGFYIGAYSKDAVFRDLPPEGGSIGALKITELDVRTIKVVNEFSEEEIGSRYRGIYWKIKYNNFEDIKGKWVLHNNYSNYNNTKILPEIQDWGNGVDAISIQRPNGSKTVYDLFNEISSFKEEHVSDGKWTGVLETQGYFYVTFFRYSNDGTVPEFEDILSFDHITGKEHVIASDFTEEAEEKIKNLIGNQGLIQVTNWGDSLTAGSGSTNHTNQEIVLNAIKNKGYPELSLTATSNITYSIMMQELLGDTYNVTNCGVGGETINTIAARLGANIAYAKNSFTLPADMSSVNLSTDGSLDSAWGIGLVSPLKQGSGNSVNPCYVQGVECTLSYASNTYSLKRNSQGDRDIEFSSKTPIIFSGSKLYRNTKIAVIWCWQNGGYSDNDELIEKLDKIISHINTSNYLLVGLHSGTSASRQIQEELLTSKYGDKFFNWREYASTNALYDFGLTPSEEDETAMSAGSMPKTLLIDGVHLCAAGYAILGYKIIERFKNLGYIEE